jgi:glucosamine-6-phosphate deaminase
VVDGATEPLETRSVDRLRVRIYRDRVTMGRAAAREVAAAVREALARQAAVRMVFAAAPSQNELLDALAATPDLDWSRVTSFQLDEYLGLRPDAPQTFSHYLRDRLFDRVRPGNVQLIDGDADPISEARRYADLLAAAPLDIVCLGIGENGHLAFNDPPADFDDPNLVKLVTLDAASRQQQVHDGCFPALEAVPAQALTVTIPLIMSGQRLTCVVPGAAKAEAVERTLHGVISPACPASVLRRHANCTLYLDADSARDVRSSRRSASGRPD